MQKHVNLVDLVKSFPTNILLQNLASIQKRTSPIKFAHLAEESEKGSISNLSTKALASVDERMARFVHLEGTEEQVRMQAASAALRCCFGLWWGKGWLDGAKFAEVIVRQILHCSFLAVSKLFFFVTKNQLSISAASGLFQKKEKKS